MPFKRSYTYIDIEGKRLEVQKAKKGSELVISFLEVIKFLTLRTYLTVHTLKTIGTIKFLFCMYFFTTKMWINHNQRQFSTRRGHINNHPEQATTKK